MDSRCCEGMSCERLYETDKFHTCFATKEDKKEDTLAIASPNVTQMEADVKETPAVPVKEHVEEIPAVPVEEDVKETPAVPVEDTSAALVEDGHQLTPRQLGPAGEKCKMEDSKSLNSVSIAKDVHDHLRDKC